MIKISKIKITLLGIEIISNLLFAIYRDNFNNCELSKA